MTAETTQNFGQKDHICSKDHPGIQETIGLTPETINIDHSVLMEQRQPPTYSRDLYFKPKIKRRSLT
jgi:hypothetical protein